MGAATIRDAQRHSHDFLLFCFGGKGLINMSASGVQPARHIANALNPLGHAIGLDGVILWNFQLRVRMQPGDERAVIRQPATQ